MEQAASYRFHSEALLEYSKATEFYLFRAGEVVAGNFVAEVEAAIASVIASPAIWRIVETPGIRRYRVQRFPYALYYRWEAEKRQVMVYALMHLRQKPGYWRTRLS